MPDVAKLKKKAAELELKKQFDKALAVYVEILDSYDESDEELDVALFNRVGDLYLKQGNVADAVDYYEQAVDRYAESGFFNNAIALCNKILRNSPGPRVDLLQARQDQRAEGLQQRREDQLPRVRRPDAEVRQDRRGVSRAEGVRRSLSRSGRHPAHARRSALEAGARPEAIEQLQMLYERYTARAASSRRAPRSIA